MDILSLLCSDNFIVVNKALAKEIGLESAVVLGALVSKHKYWSDRGELKDGFFYSTVEDLKESVFLSAYSQREAIKKLQENNLIEVKKMGLPSRRYIKINVETLENMLNDKSLKNLTTCDKEISQQEVKNFDTNNNRINKNTEQEQIREEERKKEPRKQTYDDVLDSECLISLNTDLRDTFLEFIKMRNLIKKPLTDRALKLIISKTKELANGNPDVMQQILEQSIQNSWQGVFALKDENQRVIKSQPMKPVNDYQEQLMAFAMEDNNNDKTRLGFDI